MSGAPWSTTGVEEEECDQPVGPVVDQQHGYKKTKREVSPTEIQDVPPNEEETDAGAPEVQGEGEGTNLEGDAQELVKPTTRAESGENPEVIGDTCAKPEPNEVQETECLPPTQEGLPPGPCPICGGKGLWKRQGKPPF